MKITGGLFNLHFYIKNINLGSWRVLVLIQVASLCSARQAHATTQLNEKLVRDNKAQTGLKLGLRAGFSQNPNFLTPRFANCYIFSFVLLS